MPTHFRSTRRASAALTVALLAVELVDELVFGAHNAAWPMIRADLRLSYAQIGALLTLPAVFGSLVEPAIGILGDAWDRRRLIIGGGIAFVVAVAVTALSYDWAVLLLALALNSPASGAFVSLSQATLMDAAPARHEQLMARWVVAGSVGVIGGTALIGLVARFGASWRVAFAVLAIASVMALAGVWFTGAARSHQRTGDAVGLGPSLRAGARDVLAALRRSEVRRWLILLECANLMLDVLGSFLALYLVDVARATPAQAAFGLSLFAGIGLAGDALLVPLLERTDGIRYLRTSVGLTLIVFPGMLLADGLWPKFACIALLGLLNSGWYAIPQARLYSAMPDRSASVMTLANAFGILGGLVPLLLGEFAQHFGLNWTMWLLLAGPLGLAIGLFRRGS